MNSSSPPRENAQNVIVIGGGPVGSFAALNLARLGAKVVVLEEHTSIGVPSHCAGHLSIRSLANLGLYPLPEKIVENTFARARFISPAGYELSVRLNKQVTCVVNREAFDRHISDKAEKAGVNYFLNSRVQSIIIQNGLVKGVTFKRNDEKETAIAANLVIDAEGISSRLLKQMGLSPLNRDGLVYAVEAEIENVRELERDAVEVFLGKEYAPGFYAWVIPRLDGTAKVGLATRSRDPREFLRRLMHKHPVASKHLDKANIVRMAFHPISLSGPIGTAYSNGFLAIGDAASQVKPTTGGGVILGLTCARIAAEVSFEAIKKNDFSSNCLQAYQKRCDKSLNFDMRVMLRIRNMLNKLSDEKVNKAIRFCARMGLEKALEDIDEIDFQGQTLLKILHKPEVFPVFAYLITLYLYANA